MPAAPKTIHTQVMFVGSSPSLSKSQGGSCSIALKLYMGAQNLLWWPFFKDVLPPSTALCDEGCTML